jgi:hypothetical protein
MNNLTVLNNLNLNQLGLPITPEIKQEAWKKAQATSNNRSRHRAYLNLLAIACFLSWLEEMLESHGAKSWELEDNLTVWEFVNGGAIELENCRLVLIPHDDEDFEEMSLPEEWLSIPNWVGNYYGAAQVNVDENWVRFWGYISYQDLINYAQTQELNKCTNYQFNCVDVPAYLLEEDINMFLLDYEYVELTAPEINPLPLLSAAEKKAIISQITTNLSPRLWLPFGQWASLMASPVTRKELYQRRQPVKLRTWLTQNLQGVLQQGWEAMETLTAEYLLPSLAPSAPLALRSLSAPQSLSILKEDNENEYLQTEAIAVLGALSPDSNLLAEAIALLSNIVETNLNEEIRWNAALSLRLLAPLHPCSGKWRGKLVNLGMELVNAQLALVMGILPKGDEQTSIFLRVYPTNKQGKLPEGLCLQIVDETGAVFKEIVSGREDNLIQYKFWGNLGEQFQVRLGLNDLWLNENFLV